MCYSACGCINNMLVFKLLLSQWVLSLQPVPTVCLLMVPVHSLTQQDGDTPMALRRVRKCKISLNNPMEPHRNTCRHHLFSLQEGLIEISKNLTNPICESGADMSG